MGSCTSVDVSDFFVAPSSNEAKDLCFSEAVAKFAGSCGVENNDLRSATGVGGGREDAEELA